MSIRIECLVKGENVALTLSEVMNRAQARGCRVFMENPETVAVGDGVIAIDIPEDDRAEAEAVLDSILDEVPGARDAIRPVPPGEGFDPA